MRTKTVSAFLICLSLATSLAFGQSTATAPPTSGASTRPVPRPQVNQQALDKLGWRLACQAWTFRRLTLFDTIDLLDQMGIRYLEMYPGQRFSPQHPDLKADHNLSDERIAELHAKLKFKNVTAVNFGVAGLPKDEAGSRKVFEFAKKMKLETIVSEPAAESVPMIDKLAAEYGIKVAIHDHPKPSFWWNCHTVLEHTKDHQHVGACADIGHWRRSGLEPVECIRTLKGKIISLHVKDIDEQKHDVIWGTGTVDVRAVLEELHKQQAKVVLSIEYERTEGDELIHNVAKSVEFFNTVATELAGK